MFPPPEQQAAPNLALLTTDPFGDAPHLVGLEPKIKTSSPSISATDPKELKALLDPQKKVDMSHNSKLKVFPLKNARVSSCCFFFSIYCLSLFILCGKSFQDSLFEGLSPRFKEETNSPEYVKTNCRRLVLKQRPSNSGDSSSPGLMRTDILKHILSPEENKDSSKEGARIESTVPNDLRTVPLRLNFDNTVNETKNASAQSQTFKIIANGIDKNIGPGIKLTHNDYLTSYYFL